MVVLCQVDVLYFIVECDRFPPTRDVLRPEFESRRGSRHAKIQGQLNVRALNDGFTALNSVAAMSQSGRTLPVADVPATGRLVSTHAAFREWPLSRPLADGRESAFPFLRAPVLQRARLSNITIR
jgi:hypothetical protein